MRKNSTFAVAVMIIGLTMFFCVRWSVVASSADVGPKFGVSPFAVTSSAYLPFQVLEPVY